MPKGDYPSSIGGFRLLLQRELPPVATCWDFQTTETLVPNSARCLLTDLPEDYELSYFDPDYGQEEAWIFVRRAGQCYFVKNVRRGSSPSWSEQSLEAVLNSFTASPLVQKPVDSLASFTISSIPHHQRDDHLRGKV
jgi:hypothetical protein